MEVRSITATPGIGSFRMRQTIVTSYRDLPEANTTSSMLVEARRDPPAVQTTLSSDDGSTNTTIMIANELWTQSSGAWAQSDVGDAPDDWTLRAYREIGDMSLVTPLSAQVVVDAARAISVEDVQGVNATKFHAGSDLMIRLANDAFEARRQARDTAPAADQSPPDTYIHRYEADLWVDPETGFIVRERTVIEYTEERLHGRQVGTGPATFETTREFFDFNAGINLTRPGN